MAILSKDLARMTDGTKDAYIKLRQSLDSLTYVALAEFDFNNSTADRRELDDIESEAEQKEIANKVKANRMQIAETVADGVESMLREITKERDKLWREVASARAADFVQHCHDLVGDEEFAKHSGNILKPKTDEEKAASRAATFSRTGDNPIGCPPGFMEVDGICVPI